MSLGELPLKDKHDQGQGMHSESVPLPQSCIPDTKDMHFSLAQVPTGAVTVFQTDVSSFI